MPNWSSVLKEIEGERHKLDRQDKQQRPGPLDRVRRRYLKRLHNHTGRNVICYYSGWLLRESGPPQLGVTDADKNGLMSAVHGLDRKLGLDLVLHTPGGDLAAAESLVDYLRRIFDRDIRAVVPQLAMSAGTMIACACRSILMGRQSNLGPIDPQIGGVPASGVLLEFKKAIDDIRADPAAAVVWTPIIQKYHPTFLQACENAVAWADEITKNWLRTGMFSDDDDAEEKAERITRSLSDTQTTLNHSRHIHIDQLEEMGLNIERMEEDQDLQDLVLTVHHALMHTFASTNAIKIIENHNGVATIVGVNQKK